MQTTEIEITGAVAGERRMRAHLARPAGSERLPAVVVAMEAFGLNDHIRRVTERIAAEGYVTVAPDFYFRQPDAVAAYSDLPRALSLMSQVDDREVVSDMRAVLATLAARPDVVADRVGMTGFCMGGRITFLSACHLPLRAAVPFYGGGIGRLWSESPRTPHPPIDDVAGITGAMLLFYGGKDAMIPPDEVSLVRERLAGAGKSAEVVVYPNADHGFFCDERPSYDPSAAADAWKRMTAHLALHLRA